MTAKGPSRSGAPRTSRSQLDLFVESARVATPEIAADAGVDAGIDPTVLGGYLDAALDAAGAGRRLTQGELAACRQLGELAAEAGMGLSALLDLYLSATWRLWGVLGTHAAAAPRATIVSVAGGLFRAADDAAAALTHGYAAAQRLTVRREEALRREFVDDLLGGNAERRLLQERAARFGFNLAGTHIVAVARTDRMLVDAGPIHTRVETHVLITFGGRDVVVATKEGALVCVLPTPSGADSAADLARTLEESGEGPWRLGVGRPYAGPGGVVRSYDEAREAMELARRLGVPGPVVDYESLLPYRLLTLDPVTAAEVARAVLGPLGRARGGETPLVETLEAYFAEGGNVSATARRLHLSPRAVVYRLERIGQLTSYQPQDPDDRFVLELAVRARRLLDPP